MENLNQQNQPQGQQQPAHLPQQGAIDATRQFIQAGEYLNHGARRRLRKNVPLFYPVQEQNTVAENEALTTAIKKKFNDATLTQVGDELRLARVHRDQLDYTPQPFHVDEDVTLPYEFDEEDVIPHIKLSKGWYKFMRKWTLVALSVWGLMCYFGNPYMCLKHHYIVGAMITALFLYTMIFMRQRSNPIIRYKVCLRRTFTFENLVNDLAADLRSENNALLNITMTNTPCRVTEKAAYIVTFDLRLKGEFTTIENDITLMIIDYDTEHDCLLTRKQRALLSDGRNFQIDVELLSQLNGPKFMVRTEDETRLKENMSYCARHYSTINFNRYEYMQNNTVDNTIEIAFLQYQDRMQRDAKTDF